jgi:predicted RNase H-like HicB family nuclease
LYPCPEGGFTAFCDEIKGAVSQGETREEALENLFDAVKEIWAATAEMAQEKTAALPKASGRRGVRPIKSKLAELCEAH